MYVLTDGLFFPELSLLSVFLVEETEQLQIDDL